LDDAHGRVAVSGAVLREADNSGEEERDDGIPFGRDWTLMSELIGYRGREDRVEQVVRLLLLILQFPESIN